MSIDNVEHYCSREYFTAKVNMCSLGVKLALFRTYCSLYTSILSTAYVPYICTTGVIIPVIKKSTLDPNVVKNYRPITINSVHTKAIESFIIPSAEISDNQFGFRESRGTAFACNLLNDVTSYCKSRNSPLFLATLDAEKCFDSICHVSLFLKLIYVLPTYQWLLLYNWYRKLNAVVKWNGCYSKGPATRNDFVNDIVDDARADAIFATLKTIVDDIVTCGRALRCLI